MFSSIKKLVHVIESMQSVNIVQCPTLCAKPDAHDKLGFKYISINIYIGSSSEAVVTSLID